MKSFVNPYFKCFVGGKSEAYRLVAWIPRSVHDDIARIRPSNGKALRALEGTWQTTINIIIEKLHHELIRQGFTDGTKQSEFEHFIANCKIVGPRKSNKRTARSAVSSNDAGAKIGCGDKNKGNESE